MDPFRIAALLAPFLGDVARAPSPAALSDAQLSQLSTYLDLLLRWNARINLTAIRGPEQIVSRHFGESLFAARSLYPEGWQLATGDRLLDFGSGAGFPGLPIKIWAPALRLTLIESTYRKTIFLREVIRALALTGAGVFPGRAEEFDFNAADHSGAGNLGGSEGERRAGDVASAITITLRAVERFDRVLPAAARLLAAAPARSRRLALLVGGPQVARARQLLPGIAWSDPLPIPQSSRRVLFIGSVTDR